MKIITLFVLTGTLVMFGCGKRKTTPPPEAPTEVSELEIDFGDEFIPSEGGEVSFDIGIGE